jgi:hypothetical protein
MTADESGRAQIPALSRVYTVVRQNIVFTVTMWQTAAQRKTT